MGLFNKFNFQITFGYHQGVTIIANITLDLLIFSELGSARNNYNFNPFFMFFASWEMYV